MSKKVLHTKFGIAKLYNHYFIISTRIEGNHGKYLHKLIFESFYGFEVPDEFVVHHKDGNKTNNCILNLQLMRETDHRKLHMADGNSPNIGRTHTEETKQKISVAHKGRTHSLEHCLNASKSRGNTGFYRVGIHKDKRVKQGWYYRYQYKDKNGKMQSICSMDIKKLKKKVIDKGLEWIEY